MRRILIVLLAVCIGLSGCGSLGPGPSDPPADAQGQSLPAGSAEPEPAPSGVAVFGKAAAAKAAPNRQPPPVEGRGEAGAVAEPPAGHRGRSAPTGTEAGSGH